MGSAAGSSHNATIHGHLRLPPVERLAQLVVSRLKSTRGERGRADTGMEVSRLEHYDPLTGLLNRVRFHDEADQSLAKDRAAAIVLLDLDRFKDLNDTLGHKAGDTILVAIGERLRQNTRRGQLLSRHAGDEFALLLPGFAEPRSAYLAARHFIDCFRDGFTVDGTAVPIDASAGIAVAPHHGSTADELLIAADLALRQAKSHGGGKIKFYEPHLRHQVVSRRTMQCELRRAFEDREFEVVYQPQLDFASRRIIGAEALLRWNHPEHGQLAPADFLPTLAEMPLSTAVGDWITETAIAQAAYWRRLGVPLRVAVNLFASEFRSGDVAERIGTQLAVHQLPATLFEVELTETIAIASCSAVASTLDELRRRGVGVALDDFGTGYASLSVLKDLPISRLKIDKSFVRDLRPDSHDATLVEAISKMARAFGLKVVAEGVETVDQEKWLVGAGCQQGQGYLYGAPMAAQRLLRLATALRCTRADDEQRYPR